MYNVSRTNYFYEKKTLFIFQKRALTSHCSSCSASLLFGFLHFHSIAKYTKTPVEGLVWKRNVRLKSKKIIQKFQPNLTFFAPLLSFSFSGFYSFGFYLFKHIEGGGRCRKSTQEYSGKLKKKAQSFLNNLKEHQFAKPSLVYTKFLLFCWFSPLLLSCWFTHESPAQSVDCTV